MAHTCPTCKHIEYDQGDFRTPPERPLPPPKVLPPPPPNMSPRLTPVKLKVNLLPGKNPMVAIDPRDIGIRRHATHFRDVALVIGGTMTATIGSFYIILSVGGTTLGLSIIAAIVVGVGIVWGNAVHQK